MTCNVLRKRLLFTRSFPDLTLKIPPPLYMLAFAVAMWLLSHYQPFIIWLDSPWNKIGLGIMFLSMFPAPSAFRLFSRFHTTADPRHPDKASQLVTSGVFSFTRNPMYLSLLLFLTGWAIHLGSLPALFFPALFFIVITKFQILPEEVMLEKAFGEEYLKYKQTVRRWL